MITKAFGKIPNAFVLPINYLTELSNNNIIYLSYSEIKSTKESRL